MLREVGRIIIYKKDDAVRLVVDTAGEVGFNQHDQLDGNGESFYDALESLLEEVETVNGR